MSSKSLVYESVLSCKHSPMVPIWEWKVLSTNVTFMTWYLYFVKPWMLSTISRSPNSPSTAFWDDHSIQRKLRVPSLKLSIMSNPGSPFLNSVKRPKRAQILSSRLTPSKTPTTPKSLSNSSLLKELSFSEAVASSRACFVL